MHRTVLQQIAKNQMNLEIYLTDHCNLNCRGCNRFSNLAKKKEYDYDTLIKDLDYINKNNFNVDHFTLTGGEPLLHSKIAEIIEYILLNFEKTFVVIQTNLKKFFKMPDKFYDVIKTNRVQIFYTAYANVEHKKVQEYCDNNGIYAQNTNPLEHVNTDAKDVFWLEPIADPKIITPALQSNKYSNMCKCSCIALKDSIIYKCGKTANIEILNNKFNSNYKLDNSDYISLYDVKSVKDYINFIVKSGSFCNYCFNSKHYTIPFETNKIVKEDYIQ